MLTSGKSGKVYEAQYGNECRIGFAEIKIFEELEDGKKGDLAKYKHRAGEIIENNTYRLTIIFWNWHHENLGHKVEITFQKPKTDEHGNPVIPYDFDCTNW